MFGVFGLVGIGSQTYTATGLAALLFGIFCLYGSRHFADAPWGSHVRIGFGLLIIGVGGALAGPAHSAANLILVYPILVPVYLYEARMALPYLIFGTTILFVSLLILDDATAHAIVTGTVVFGIGIATIGLQREIRKIALINGRLAIVDPLTGTANVRRLHEKLGTAITAAEHGGPRPVLYGMDLDDFKLVNDRFSHAMGDDVLRAVAAAIQVELQPGDLLARRGGDEFSVLIADPANRSLADLGDALRSAITRARQLTCPEVNPHGSVGFVTWEPGSSLDGFMTRCDDALHEAKLDAHPERRDIKHGDVIELADRRRGHAVRIDAAATDDTHLADELSMVRTIKRTLGNGSVWQIGAIACLSIVVAGFATMLTASGNELRETGAIVTICAMAVLGSVAGLFSRRGTHPLLPHFGIFGCIAMLALLLHNVHELRPMMADVFLVPAVMAAYAFEKRAALMYFLLSLACFDAALVTSDYDFVGMRIGVTSVISLVMFGMLAKARKVSEDFASHAIELSTIDPLTGAANVRGMRRRVADAIERCDATGMKLGLIAIDLDDFKQVNDRHSHTLGDRVLVAVAETMRSAVRGDDLVVRRGGDEFALICTFDDELEVHNLATRLAESIAEIRSEIVSDVNPSASVAAVIRSDRENVDAFLRRSDDLLHDAKVKSHSGRFADGQRSAG
ncbi:MAG TPA: GGDEF domain-containing protein [Solirubrobacterales bacterium]|jgi:diguanylate cyclase (GGDEF)-like protein|nr:GGDEF domain-containing protein [Solirubrobacterales bacterium]